MAPSQTQIAISSLQRLLKEEASYHKELESQKKRITKLEESNDDEDGNKEFTLKQEVGQQFFDNWLPSLAILPTPSHVVPNLVVVHLLQPLNHVA